MTTMPMGPVTPCLDGGFILLWGSYTLGVSPDGKVLARWDGGERQFDSMHQFLSHAAPTRYDAYPEEYPL